MEDAGFELVIPLKAEYVSIARLTVSGVANRAGFDYEAIEDVKVALSEVCNHLIGGRERDGKADAPNCRMRFGISGGALTISFLSDEGSKLEWHAGSAEDGEYDQLGPSLIGLLMDDFVVCADGEPCVVTMRKLLDSPSP